MVLNWLNIVHAYWGFQVTLKGFKDDFQGFPMVIVYEWGFYDLKIILMIQWWFSIRNDDWRMMNERMILGKDNSPLMNDKWVFTPKNERMIECSWAIPKCYLLNLLIISYMLPKVF